MKGFLFFLLFVFLTLLTQIGGIVLLLCLPVFGYFRTRVRRRFWRFLMQVVSFCFFYMVCTIAVVPPLAKLCGRVALPFSDKHLKPLNMGTCILNRHYVRPKLYKTTMEIADKMELTYEGTKVLYLDANFPFLDGFPMVPHLSHNDGRKLDFSFCYKNAISGSPVNYAPSFIGYGVCEVPLEEEEDRPASCEHLGYYQYSILEKIMPYGNRDNFIFDGDKTRSFIVLFAEHKAVDKIFLEPHLKSRLGLGGYEKIRFHGCQAIRHDDHFHVEIK